MADSGTKRILCIHGFRASPAVMEFQTTPLKTALTGCEFVYMPGRLETQTPCDPVTDGGTLSEAVMLAVEDTRKFIAQNGPFHAVIAFSQVVACVCGVRPDHRNEAPDLNALITAQTPLKCPNVHVIGKMDPLRPKGLLLKEVYDSTNQTFLEHSKGHQFPPWQEKESNAAFAAALQWTGLWQALLDASPPNATFQP